MIITTGSLCLKFFDPVHGFIDCDPIEAELIGMPYFERLRSIHQLGLAFWVYPGGRSSRYEHTLGVMEVASRIYDRIISSPYSIDPGLNTEEIVAWRRLLRLAALSHDLGHLPFSHHAERALLGSRGHESITVQIIEELSGFFDAAELPGSVIKIALGPAKCRELGLDCDFTPWEELLASIITSDFCGADRIDYLLRDAQTTGLVHGRFDDAQLIDKLCIVDDGGLKLGIYSSGLESIESLLVARYFMHKRLYYHPQVRTLAMHASHVMSRYFPHAASREHFLEISDMEVLSFIRGKTESSPHLDALRSERMRYHALEIHLFSDQEAIQQELAGIPDIDCTYATYVEEKRLSDFPALLADGEVVSCTMLSPLLAAKLPIGARHWIFAACASIPKLATMEPKTFTWKLAP